MALLTLALASGTGVVTSAQRAVSTGPQNVPLTAPVPVDPRITVGTLSNGLRYYVRANKQPEDRAELRLVVNAGSVLEDDDQRGLAHFVEHMCFNGTRHFPKQDVVAFLQSTGMRFGAHINANTSFDQTVYQLADSDRQTRRVIDRSLLILEDWAHAVSFDPEEIDKERGVILEEWRTGLGPGARMLDVQLPVLLKDSRYAERLPIGKPEIIRTFPYDRLKKFYTDWYRPDLMAVIAVGDFDPAAIETLIRSHFGSIPAATSTRGRGRSTTCPIIRARVYSVATDPEATLHGGQRLQHDGGARSDDRRRLSSADDRAGLRRPAVGAASPRSRRSRTRRFWMRTRTGDSSSVRRRPRRSARWSPTAASSEGSPRSSPRPIASRGSASRRPSWIATA